MKFQGLLFIDVDVRVGVRVRVQFKHILCLVVHSFRGNLLTQPDSMILSFAYMVHSFRGNLLTQPDSMILSFAYMVAAEQLKKKKKKTLPDQHVYVVAFLAW